MPGQYTEHAFETAIEHHLTAAGGYTKGDPKTYDTERGLFPQEVLTFIKATQEEEWAYLETLQKEKAEETRRDCGVSP
jgi:type I restriction enzyme, R subunit